MKTQVSNTQELLNKDTKNLKSTNFGEQVEHSIAYIIEGLESKIETEKMNDMLTNPANSEEKDRDETPKEHQVEFGKRLKASRIRAGYTQNDIAERFGVNSSVISNYERGYRDPASYKLKILADMFHVSVDYLLGRTDNTLLADTIAVELSTVKEVRKKMSFLDGKNNDENVETNPKEPLVLTRSEIEEILDNNQFIRWYRESPDSFSKELADLSKMAHLIEQQ